jgi:hypothetical protein
LGAKWAFFQPNHFVWASLQPQKSSRIKAQQQPYTTNFMLVEQTVYHNKKGSYHNKPKISGTNKNYAASIKNLFVQTLFMLLTGLNNCLVSCTDICLFVQLFLF